MLLKVKQFKPDAKLPTRGSAEAAGLDLYSYDDRVLPPGVVVAISTGISVEIPTGNFGLICDRSGLASKGITTQAVKVAPGAFDFWESHGEQCCYALGGVIDSDYRGELKVLLLNTSDKEVLIKTGDRVAQMIVMEHLKPQPIMITDGELTATDRGTKGLGSTGK